MTKRHSTPTLAFLLGVDLSLTAFASAAEIPSADEIVEHYVEAVGGRQALEAIETVRASGGYDFNGETRPMVVIRQRPNRFRIQLDIDGQEYVEASDGNVSWSFFPGREEKLELKDEDAASRFLEEFSDFDGPLIDYKQKGHELAVVGREDVDGTSCFHLLLKMASGYEQHWYLDSESYELVRKVTTGIHPRRGPYERVWYYESFEEVEGVKLPLYFEREDRQFVRAYDFSEIEVNVEVDEALFSPPELD